MYVIIGRKFERSQGLVESRNSKTWTEELITSSEKFTNKYNGRFIYIYIYTLLSHLPIITRYFIERIRSG